MAAPSGPKLTGPRSCDPDAPRRRDGRREPPVDRRGVPARWLLSVRPATARRGPEWTVRWKSPMAPSRSLASSSQLW